MTIKQKIIKNVKETVESLLIALLIALVIRTFVVQAFKIPSGSMRPTLIEGDRIFVWKLPYWFARDPVRGDVIVFKYPEDPKKDYIKRLAGLGEEEIRIQDGSIIVDDKLITENNFSNRYYYNRDKYGSKGQTIAIPTRSFYVLGDNSANSRDSRYWGFVPRKNIVGKAVFIYWPLNRIRIIN